MLSITDVAAFSESQGQVEEADNNQKRNKHALVINPTKEKHGEGNRERGREKENKRRERGRTGFPTSRPPQIIRSVVICWPKRHVSFPAGWWGDSS